MIIVIVMGTPTLYGPCRSARRRKTASFLGTLRPVVQLWPRLIVRGRLANAK